MVRTSSIAMPSLVSCSDFASVNANFHAFIRRRLDIISSSKDFC